VLKFISLGDAIFFTFAQGCSANKKGVGMHPKNGHFETASNTLQNKT